jgi:2-keto-4-pentenoate hydratase
MNRHTTDVEGETVSLAADAREEVANELVTAYRDAEAVSPPGRRYDISIEDGYAIQERVVEGRRAVDGSVVGYKVGATNQTVQKRLGLDGPVFGRVLEGTVLSGPLDADRAISPKLEPEIVFVVEKPLSGAVTPTQVRAATRGVVPVVELADSRVEDWGASPGGIVADNALARAVGFGTGLVDIRDRDLSLEGVVVRVNGELVDGGVGAFALGDPARAVAALSAHLGERGEEMTPGEFVLTGTLCPPVPVSAGDAVTVEYTTLGSATVRVA